MLLIVKQLKVQNFELISHLDSLARTFKKQNKKEEEEKGSQREDGR